MNIKLELQKRKHHFTNYNMVFMEDYGGNARQGKVLNNINLIKMFAVPSSPYLYPNTFKFLFIYLIMYFNLDD